MKALIRHTDDLAPVLAEWRAEHDAYYARPHAIGQRERGAREVDSIAGRLTVMPGYIDPADAVAIVAQASREPLTVLAGALQAEEQAGGWLTSGGNMTLCVPAANLCGPWLEYRDGARHGLPVAAPARRGSWHYIETQRPDVSPDAYGLDPAPEPA